MRFHFTAVVLLALSAIGGVRAESSVRDPAALALASVHAAVADLGSGELMYRKHDEKPVPIASVTKLMTAIVVLDSAAPLDEWLTVMRRETPAPVNAYSRIRTGSQLRRGDLLRITLMASENQAAYVLSRHHPGGRDAFISAMNDKARALGMLQTRFVDSSGLSAENRSTAADLLKLLAAAMDYALIREFTRTPQFTAQFRNPHYTLSYGNTNLLVHRESWDIELSKTGYLDAAGRCLVMVANIDGRPVAMVLLDSFGSRTPLGDAGRIGRWLRTGHSGVVAGPALDYERRRVLEFQRSDRVAGTCAAAGTASATAC